MDKKKILVVDDERDLTAMLKLNLENTGKYEVATENSGESAVNAARNSRPELILLDILMPGMSGNEVAHVLSCNEATKDIPIVFLTAMVRDSEISGKSRLIGGHPFVAKPADVDKIVDVIDRYMR